MRPLLLVVSLFATVARAAAGTAQDAEREGDWSVELRRVLVRDVLCSMESEQPRGACDVDGSVVAGPWTVSVVHPHEHGSYLGDPTMKWHLFFERPGARYGTVQPIDHEVTVCTGDGTTRLGGRDAFVLEELAARDLVGRPVPEVIVRWRQAPGTPVRVHVCSLEGPRPRCAGPLEDGEIVRDADGFRVGAVRLGAP